MPNWCNNHVVISHEDPAKIRALADAYNRQEFCNHVIPTPKELTETVSGCVGKDQEDAHKAQIESNLKKYGHADWYSFQTSNWGTKWDCGGDGCDADVTEDGCTMSAGFDSAWSPPIGVYEALIEQGFKVEAMYYEPGMGYAGIFNENGDDYYELGDLDSKAVADTINSELDEMFGISETMAEYEEEERLNEELYAFVKEGAEKRKDIGLVGDYDPHNTVNS